jgi:alpha-ribazole phosphatase
VKAVTLYLVRHGAVISVQGKAYIGQVEAPLDELGVEQAWALRRWLEPVPFSSAYSSDLSRSRRTARIIVGSRRLSVQEIPAFREIGLGAWDGYTFREIESRFPAEFAARGRDLENWRPPGGESFADLRDRVLPALQRVLAAAEGNVLLVSHAGVNRLILCDALGVPAARLFSIGQDYGCINILEYGERRVRLQLLNFVPSPTEGSSILPRRRVHATSRGKRGARVHLSGQ